MQYLKLYEEYFDKSSEFPHQYQNKAYTCGPTSVKIILDFLKFPQSVSVDYLEKISGTNDKTGCTDVNLSKMLDIIGVSYKRYVGKSENISMNVIYNQISNGYKIILRTLTKGIKHWIVLYDIKDGKYMISDPWLGRIQYNREELISILEPRDYDFFVILDKEIENRPTIEKIISDADKSECTEMVAEQFKDLMTKEESYEYLDESVNWDISVKLVLNDKIIGCYLLAEHDLEYDEFVDKKGIEGVALVILEEFRSFGYGKMMIAYTENLPYDYIWGQHLKGIGNLEQWKKRRNFLFDGDDVWITAKYL